RLMSKLSPPFHSHMCSKRTAALLDAGVSSSAFIHVLPPSALTSTREILPRPDQARPLTRHQPGPVSFSGYAGEVMTDFASISKLNQRALPPGSGSVYFEVSHR